MLFRSEWRCVFYTISACYVKEFGRNDPLEDTRGLGEGGLCRVHANVVSTLVAATFCVRSTGRGERLGTHDHRT